MNITDRIKNIARKNGKQVVRAKTKEECIELSEALERNDYDDIIDETADVLHMITQLMEVYDIEEQVEKRLEFKVERTERRYGY